MPNTKSDAYYALALQIKCQALNAVTTREDALASINSSVERIDKAIAGALAFLGRDTRLVVLPEYALTGHPMGESLKEWHDKAAIDMDGPEYDALGKVAQNHDIYLAANAYERDPNFPDYYFQASTLIAPSGDIVLRYRRLISMFSPSPWDVWDKYLDVYGEEAIFPVAETEIGRIGTIASEEILYPELARILASRGAEVFVHSSSEVGSNKQTIKDTGKKARAIENLAYVVSANSAGIAGSPVLEASTDGFSQILNYKGDQLCEAGYGESVNAFAEIDLAALRRYRHRPAMGNLLARQPMQLYAQFYKQSDIHPANELLEEGEARTPERSYFVKRQQQVIEKLSKAGLIK
jgi:predicted amidohydrolase